MIKKRNSIAGIKSCHGQQNRKEKQNESRRCGKVKNQPPDLTAGEFNRSE
jgi:hypothetical protein